MSEVAAAAQVALDGGGPVARDLVVDWCHRASDPTSLALLYCLTGEEYDESSQSLGSWRPVVSSRGTCWRAFD